MAQLHLTAVTVGPSSSAGPHDPALKEIRKGYQAFTAPESIFPSNVALACTAKLYYTNNNITSTVAGVANSCIHPEMDALHNFYVGICNYNDHAFRSVLLSMESGPSPCCIRCSAVLGLLGVVAMPNTFKTPKPMGTTRWQIPDSIAQLLAIKTGNNEGLYKQFGIIQI